MTHDAGAAAKVYRTEMMRPKLACALEAAIENPTEPAIPRAISKTTLAAVPQR
jgi:phage baseplate assembly protein W